MLKLNILYGKFNMELGDNFFSITGSFKTPFVVYSLEKIKKNFLSIKSNYQGIKIYYALKANPLPRILELLNNNGSGFEVASKGEVEQLLALNIEPKKMICLHPIKSPEFLSFLKKIGVEILAADSYEEIDKIEKFAPGSKILARVSVNNEGSRWQLTEKFGIESTEFPHFFRYINSKKLVPYGLTFHVGSQCENERNWITAIKTCKDIWVSSRKESIFLKMLSLGGGLPVQYRHPIPNLSNTFDLINKEIQTFPDCENLLISIEPGRALVGNAAILTTSVFGVAKRGTKNWAYIETGIFNYLHEAYELSDPFFYPVFVNKETVKKELYNLGGPTCVTFDTPFKDIELPKLDVGDKIYIQNVGAYSEPCSSAFNGFPAPTVYYWEELE